MRRFIPSSHFLCLAALVLAATGLAGEQKLAGGEEYPLLISPSGHEMKVWIPADYEAGRKWPVIVFYHGMGGTPDTSLLKGYTEGRGYIIIAMPYLEGDRERSRQEQESYLKREQGNIQAALKSVSVHASIDESRVFLAGVSKGGWMAAALGEKNIPRPAGLIILLAGRAASGSQGSVAGVKDLPIYIGTGEQDPNMVPARRAREVYRRSGALVTYEEFAGKGHEVPADAVLLRAWLKVQGRQPPVPQSERLAMAAELVEPLKQALAEPEPLSQYQRLLDLAEDPRLRFCDQSFRDQMRTRFFELIKKPPVKDERAAELIFSDLLYQEAVIKSLAEMKTTLAGYQRLVQTYPETRFGRLAGLYVPGLTAAYEKSVEATRNAAESVRRTTVSGNSQRVTFPTVGSSTPVPRNVPLSKANKIPVSK